MAATAQHLAAADIRACGRIALLERHENRDEAHTSWKRAARLSENSAECRSVCTTFIAALAIALYGDDVDFGLTLDQAMEPNLGPGHDAVDPKTTTGS